MTEDVGCGSLATGPLFKSCCSRFPRGPGMWGDEWVSVTLAVSLKSLVVREHANNDLEFIFATKWIFDP